MKTRFGRTVSLLVGLAAAVLFLGALASLAGAYTWKVNGSPLTSGASELTETSNLSNVLLRGTVAGVEVEIEATKLTGWSGQIRQEGTEANGTDRWELLKLSVLKPVGCHAGTSINFVAMKTSIVSKATVIYQKFTPLTGTSLATITFEGTCALAGVPVKLAGTLYGQAPPLGWQQTYFNLAFSSTIESAAGGSLTLGGNAASFTGTANSYMTGINATHPYGVQ